MTCKLYDGKGWLTPLNAPSHARLIIGNCTMVGITDTDDVVEVIDNPSYKCCYRVNLVQSGTVRMSVILVDIINNQYVHDPSYSGDLGFFNKVLLPYALSVGDMERIIERISYYMGCHSSGLFPSEW